MEPTQNIRNGQQSQSTTTAGETPMVDACPADSLTLGRTGEEASSSSSASSRTTFSLFIDGNPARFYDVLHGGNRLVTEMTLIPDRRPSICVPAGSLREGSHAVQFRYQRQGSQMVRQRQTIRVLPAMATLTNAAVVPPSSGTSFGNDPIRVKFNTSLSIEHRVRVNVGTHVETVTIPAGAAGREFTATLTGQPKTWTDTGGTPDRRTRRYTVAVTVTPLGAGDRVGTTVNAGNVTISQPRARRSGGGGGGGGNRPPRL